MRRCGRGRGLDRAGSLASASVWLFREDSGVILRVRVLVSTWDWSWLISLALDTIIIIQCLSNECS